MEFRPLIRDQALTAGKPRHSGATKQNGIRLFVMVMALLTGLSPVSNIRAQDASRINRVKTAFVLNIARFVSWPEASYRNRHDNLRLCLYHGNPMTKAIESLHGQEVSGHPIEIRPIQTLTADSPCHILLLAHDELNKYFTETQPSPTRALLTIADMTDVAIPRTPRHDILVTLMRNGSRIGFEINLGKSRQAGLRMSSELLKLAIIVDDDN